MRQPLITPLQKLHHAAGVCVTKGMQEMASVVVRTETLMGFLMRIAPIATKLAAHVTLMGTAAIETIVLMTQILIRRRTEIAKNGEIA